MTRSTTAGLSRRGFLGLSASAVGITAATMTGCGSSRTTNSSSGGVTMWGTTGDQPFIAPTVQEWNKGHSSTRITANYFGTNDYKDKIRTAASSPQAPTLIYTWGGGTLRSYVDADLVKDLTPLLAGKTDRLSKIVPSVVESGKVDGKTYAVPLGATAPVVFYYNTEVLKKSGVDQPTSWSEVLAAVPKIKSAGFTPIALGGGSKWPYLMWIEYLVDRIGGPSVFKAVLDNNKGAWSDPAVLKACSMIQDLIAAGGFGKGFASVSADTNADLAQVVTGKAAMLLQGAWSYDSIGDIDPKFVTSGNFGFGPFPDVEGGKGDPKNIAGNPSEFWAVSAKASDSQTKSAIEYLTTMLWTDAYTKRMIDSGNIPPVTNAGQLLKGEFPKALDKMIQQAPNFQMSWDLALSPAASSAFWTQLDLLFNRSSSPNKFADAMNRTIGK